MTNNKYRSSQWNILSRLKLNSVRGAQDYLEVLGGIHRTLRPELYVEIGIRHGKSLSLAVGPAIGIDPAPEITVALDDQAQVFAKTSDDFFAQDGDTAIVQPIDLAFIDGMHWFDFALRDFVNVERHCEATSLVVFDDVFPCHPLQAARTRQTRVWTGDIWRIVACLRQFRPDLILVPIDAHPTGLLLVAGLDRTSRHLADSYEEIVADCAAIELKVPDDVLKREGAWSPNDPRVRELVDLVRQGREDSVPDELFSRQLREWRESAGL